MTMTVPIISEVGSEADTKIDPHLSRAPQIAAFAEAALTSAGLMDNQYFQALQNGAMSLPGFKVSQGQFYCAVAFFPRPMAALVARIPSARARIDILQNLVEEHGHFNEQAFHCTTFQKFLRTLDTADSALSLDSGNRREHPAVKAFNAVLNNACCLDELEVGIACMGIIEHSFAKISALIGEAVVKRGWVTSNALVHYKHHSEIDERHAEEFFAVIEPRWQDPSRRYFIEQGIELGLHIFDRLYRELYEISLLLAD